MTINDEKLEKDRLFGEIYLVLENGTPEQKKFMGRLLKEHKIGNWEKVLEHYGISLE